VTAEIDHLFVLADPGAPNADALVEAGFTEGSPRRHPGQGTTNRRFFFENAMLEFLWVERADEAGSDRVQKTHLLERWHRRDTGGSPFGICARPPANAKACAPFPAWKYRPPYLPADRSILVAENAQTIEEPFLFYLPRGEPPSDDPEHEAGLQLLTNVLVHTPVSRPFTESFRGVDGLVSVTAGDHHHMTLVFDHKNQGSTLDLRPALPLTIRY